MNPIENRIRNAIASAQSADTDARNRIYLAARSAVLKMPESHIESSMAALFEGIRNIEQEFANASPAPRAAVTQSASPAPALRAAVDAGSVSVPADPPTASIEETDTANPDIQKRNNIIIALLILAGVGAFLLAAFLLASSSNANRSSTLGQPQITTLLSIELPSDRQMLTNNPDETKLESNRIATVVNDINTTGDVTLYGRELLEVGPGEDFLMRVEFDGAASGKGPALKAGFITYDATGTRIGSGPESHAYFVQTPGLGDHHYNTQSANYVVSGVFSRDAGQEKSQFGSRTMKVRPVIVIDTANAETEFQIRKVTVQRF